VFSVVISEYVKQFKLLSKLRFKITSTWSSIK
jgi:hypothetical protein